MSVSKWTRAMLVVLGVGGLFMPSLAHAANKFFIGTDGDLTNPANWTPAGVPANTDGAVFDATATPTPAIIMFVPAAGTAAGQTWYFNNNADADSYTINGPGVVNVGRTSSTGVIKSDGYPGNDPVNILFNASVKFVGASGSVQSVDMSNGPSGGNIEFTQPLDANAGTAALQLIAGSATTNPSATIKLTGGIASTNGRNIQVLGTGTVTVGSSGTWGKIFTLGSGGNVATGNAVATASDSFGDPAAGYVDNLSTTGAIVFDNAAGITMAKTMYLRGRTDASSQYVSKSGNNTITGLLSTEKNGLGTNATIESQAGSMLTFSPTSVITNDNDGVDATYTLNLLGAGNGEIQSALVEPSATRNWNVAKDGAGTWTFTADQTYTGTTTVTAGKLIVDGVNTGGAAYSIAPGGLLGGNGSITASAVTIDGVLAPGSATAQMDLVSAVALNGSFLLNTDLAGNSDRVDVAGSLDLGGSSLLDLDGLSLLNPALTYTIASYTSLSGTFANVNSTILATHSIDYLTGNQIRLVPVPEPSAIWIAALGLVGFGSVGLKRRQIAGRIGSF